MAAFLLFHFFTFSLLTFSQDEPETAPPPLKVISKDERSRLDAETNVKDRTKLALEMMEARLVSAEKFAAGEDFNRMFNELGVFHGLMDNSVDYLNRRDDGSSKVLDSFKKLEMTLRKFGPRIEGIRREVPTRYEDYVRKLLKALRDARARAIDPLFAKS